MLQGTFSAPPFLSKGFSSEARGRLPMLCFTGAFSAPFRSKRSSVVCLSAMPVVVYVPRLCFRGDFLPLLPFRNLFFHSLETPNGFNALVTIQVYHLEA